MAKGWLRWAMVGAALILIVVVLWSVGIGDVWERIETLDPAYVLLAIACYFGVHLAWALKWFLLVRKKVKNARLPFVALANLTGNFISVTTPSGRMAGEPVRAGAVAKRYGKRFSVVFATAMLDKAGLTVAMILLLIPLVIYSYIHFDMPPLMTYLIPSFFLFWSLTGIILYLVFRRLGPRKADRFGQLSYRLCRRFLRGRFRNEDYFKLRLRRGLIGFSRTFGNLAGNPLYMVIDLSLGLLTYLFRIAAAYMFFHAIGEPQDIYTVAIVVHLAFVIGLMSQFPGMMGVGETTMTGLYLAVGVNLSAALTVSILSQLNSYLFELGFGYISMIALNIWIDIRKLRRRRAVIPDHTGK